MSYFCVTYVVRTAEALLADCRSQTPLIQSLSSRRESITEARVGSAVPTEKRWRDLQIPD
jgi:hypothetical protein